MNRLFSPGNGFAVCQLAALALTGATVIGFFAGGLNFSKWDGVQWFYGAVGLAVAFGLTAFTATAYRSRKVLMMLAAALIGISLEVAQTLERSTAMRQSRSEQSSVYQAAVAALPVAVVSLPSSEALATAKARLKAIPHRPDRKTARIEAQAEVNRLTEKRKLEQEEARDAEARTFARLQTLENDDRHAHAAVRLLMDWRGISFERASALFGVWIVAALHVAFYALGSASQPQVESLAAEALSVRIRGYWERLAAILRKPSVSVSAPAPAVIPAQPVEAALAAELPTEISTITPGVKMESVDAGPDDVEAKQAAALLEFLRKRGGEPVTLRQIISSGPHRRDVSLRNVDAANSAVNTLVNCGMVMLNGDYVQLRM